MPADEKLRDEIIGFQKARADLLQWKLIAMGGVAAVGLGSSGLSGREVAAMGIVLAVVPFVAAYCDAVGRDYDIRIALIATFLQRSGGPFSEYETFIAHTRTHWDLGGVAAHLGSSLIACLLVLLAGLFPPVTGGNHVTSRALVASAVLGGALVILAEIGYRQRRARFAKGFPQTKSASGAGPS